MARRIRPGDFPEDRGFMIRPPLYQRFDPPGMHVHPGQDHQRVGSDVVQVGGARLDTPQVFVPAPTLHPLAWRCLLYCQAYPPPHFLKIAYPKQADLLPPDGILQK
jgi:hypothetical protein